MSHTLTRRLLVQSIASGPLLRTPPVTAAAPDPILIDHGIEVRDYRVFNYGGVTRFLVEIHNTSDGAFDTPGIGVTLPHVEGGDPAWAQPAIEVLHPGSSALLVGVAPSTVTRDADWGTPRWSLCTDVSDDAARSLDAFDVDWSYETELLGDNDVVVTISVTNNGKALTPQQTIMGIVRDKAGRACGTTTPVYINGAAPGTTVDVKVRWRPESTYISNPAWLLDDASGSSIDLEFQVWPQVRIAGCAPVMPWATNGEAARWSQ